MADTLFKRKIGSTITFLLQFTADEWQAIDFRETQVICKLKQGSTTIDGIVGLDWETNEITVSIDLVGLNPGLADIDMWIGEAPIPVGYNIQVELIKGVSNEV